MQLMQLKGSTCMQLNRATYIQLKGSLVLRVQYITCGRVVVGGGAGAGGRGWPGTRERMKSSSHFCCAGEKVVAIAPELAVWEVVGHPLQYWSAQGFRSTPAEMV